MRRVMAVAAVTAVLYAALGATAAGAANPPPLPNSMAAIGDSITRAFDVCCFYGEYPEHSWSTGYDATDIVTSQYEHILGSNPAIAGDEFNDAVTGADMADAPGQAASAVSQAAEYVTILMGANDLCTGSTSTMTQPSVFRSEFQSVMATLASGLPANAHIFVSSIPDVYQLWAALHNDPSAEFVWYAAQICQSRLSPFNSEGDRQKVVSRERSFNSILKQTCGHYANCRFDNFATFNFKFTADMVSTLDYFHPDLDGQAALASATWAASWWP